MAPQEYKATCEKLLSDFNSQQITMQEYNDALRDIRDRMEQSIAERKAARLPVPDVISDDVPVPNPGLVDTGVRPADPGDITEATPPAPPPAVHP